MNIKIKYFSGDYPRLKKICKGDWIDLRIDSIESLVSKEHGTINTSELNLHFGTDGVIRYKKGDILKFGLGVAMELPKGYEAIVVPRSSTFKHWGLIQTNSPGVIDNSYCGDNDEWMIEFIAMRDGSINRFDRVCQFRIQENQPDIEFEEVDHLGNEDRGGYGTTGKGMTVKEAGESWSRGARLYAETWRKIGACKVDEIVEEIGEGGYNNEKILLYRQR